MIVFEHELQLFGSCKDPRKERYIFRAVGVGKFNASCGVVKLTGMYYAAERTEKDKDGEQSYWIHESSKSRSWHDAMGFARVIASKWNNLQEETYQYLRQA